MQRQQIHRDEIANGLVKLLAALQEAFRKKGLGEFISSHETLGVVTEEFHELVEAVRSNDTSKIKAELMDLAVAATFGYICIKKEE